MGCGVSKRDARVGAGGKSASLESDSNQHRCPTEVEERLQQRSAGSIARTDTNQQAASSFATALSLHVREQNEREEGLEEAEFLDAKDKAIQRWADETEASRSLYSQHPPVPSVLDVDGVASPISPLSSMRTSDAPSSFTSGSFYEQRVSLLSRPTASRSNSVPVPSADSPNLCDMAVEEWSHSSPRNPSPATESADRTAVTPISQNGRVRASPATVSPSRQALLRRPASQPRLRRSNTGSKEGGGLLPIVPGGTGEDSELVDS